MVPHCRSERPPGGLCGFASEGTSGTENLVCTTFSEDEYSGRYKIAQPKLIEIMHERKAAPGRPILRPALREEARKHIGDTGLLDHLLKHMTDTVVHTGERFRRRHNSEGAMEYWLEHASLMELRKAAGVEDPSWIPPAGWKVGDKLPDRNWQLSRGMTSTEAAEVKKLKETVERLRSEMKVLCGSITASNQRGALPSQCISNDDRLRAPERAEGEGNPIQVSFVMPNAVDS